MDGGYRVHHRKGFLMQAWSAVRDEARMWEKVPRTLSSFLYFLHALDYRDFSVSLLFFSTCTTMSRSSSVLF